MGHDEKQGTEKAQLSFVRNDLSLTILIDSAIATYYRGNQSIVVL
jgi:hypothetical protein